MSPQMIESCEMVKALIDAGDSINDACASAGISRYSYRRFANSSKNVVMDPHLRDESCEQEDVDDPAKLKIFAHGNWTGVRSSPLREDFPIPVRRNWAGL